MSTNTTTVDVVPNNKQEAPSILTAYASAYSCIVIVSIVARVTTIKVLSLTSRFSVQLDVEGAPPGYAEKYESGTVPYASYTAHPVSALTSTLRPDGF